MIEDCAGCWRWHPYETADTDTDEYPCPECTRQDGL